MCTPAPTDLSLREVSVELPDADSEQPEDDVHSVRLDLRLYEHHTPVAERPTHQCWKREREMFYLTTHSTHFIYGYMASDIWLRTILIVRKETRCHHIGYSYRLTARVLLYALSHIQDNTYHGLVEHWLEREIGQWVHPMKDRSDDPSHHELHPTPPVLKVYI